MEDGNRPLKEVMELGLHQLVGGAKRVDFDAEWFDAFGDKTVKVSVYWAGIVARIDIKGLK